VLTAACAALFRTMIKNIITYLLLLAPLFSTGQSIKSYTISGFIILALDEQPIPEATIMVARSKGCATNNSGKFKIKGLKSGHYKLTFSAFGYPRLDTVLNIENSDIENFVWRVKTTCNGKYNKQQAISDIKKGKANLIVIGGIAPIIYSTDKKFRRKYKVGYNIFGCIAPDMHDCLVMYNRTIFEYLDKKYGKKWRKDVRKDVAGLEHK
jgi:hypothetical protein